MRDVQDFDHSRPLITARATRVNGNELPRATPIKIVDEESDRHAELTKDQAAHLWLQGTAVYQGMALATPVESPEEYARRVVEVDDLGDGKLMIRAPWLGEGETVAEDKLSDRLEEIVSEGAEAHRELIEQYGPTAAVALVTGTDGFLASDKGNGNFEITGPGITDPIKIRGKQNALEKLVELRRAAAEQTTAESTATLPGTAEVPQGASPQAGSEISDATTGDAAGSAEAPTG